MRILMPIAQLSLGHGGAELQAHKLARALMARGHQVEIITTRPAGTPRLAELEGVPVRRLFSFGNRRAIWRLGPYSYTGLLISELRRRRDEHDIVHVHQIAHPAFAAVAARRLGGKPVLIKVATAGDFSEMLQMRRGGPSLPVGSSRMLDFTLRHGDAFIAISSAIADELAQYGAEQRRIVRIPNGVELPPLPTAEERAAARSSLGVSAGTPLAIYVGRAGEQKGADVLLRAWASVADRRPDARLIMLGEGIPQDRGLAALAALAGPSATLAGRVRDVPRYLVASDLFLLPSRGEGLSNAVLEAMVRGCCCLVSDLPANRDLIEHEHTGLVSATGDAAALAEAIVAALAAPELRARLGAAARRHVEEDFSLPRVVASYEALYERLARGVR
jgi:glycosyltransferase involved in cell wall biosynthesis